MAVSPIKAIPVRTQLKTLRQIVVEADPEYQVQDNMPVEYEFTKRNFTGPYRQRGAYAPDLGALRFNVVKHSQYIGQVI